MRFAAARIASASAWQSVIAETVAARDLRDAVGKWCGVFGAAGILVDGRVVWGDREGAGVGSAAVVVVGGVGDGGSDGSVAVTGGCVVVGVVVVVVVVGGGSPAVVPVGVVDVVVGVVVVVVGVLVVVVDVGASTPRAGDPTTVTARAGPCASAPARLPPSVPVATPAAHSATAIRVRPARVVEPGSSAFTPRAPGRCERRPPALRRSCQLRVDAPSASSGYLASETPEPFARP